MTLPETTSVAGHEILVVEDNPSSLLLLSTLLSRAGYAVRQAPNGELALWTIRSRTPDLILLDIRMPGIDGFEVCRRLKADPSTALLPVIFLSTLDEVDDKVRGLGLGAVDYIAKPYQPEEVLARVRIHLKLVQVTRDLAGVCAVLEDRVLERTAELAAREHQMASILAAMDMAGDGIIITDANNFISYANHIMLDTFGMRAAEDIIGRRAEDILADSGHTLDPSTVSAARSKVALHGSWRGELSVRQPGRNGLRRLLVHARGLPGGGRVAVLTDITETRRREEEQKRLERKLEQARKLEALGQLAGGIAHDFNNLLGAILGFAQFIVEDSREGGAQHRYASRIIKAGQQAKSLIGQILAFSHNHAEEPEPIDMAALVRDSLNILRATTDATTRLDLGRQASGQRVVGHRAQLTQVIVNLCINASAALKGNPGAVTIETSIAGPASSEFLHLADGVTAAHEAPSTLVPWTDAAGWHHVGVGQLQPGTRYLVLSVGDTGEGMSLDVMTRIFEPFFTTRGKTGGTGLGLAMVQSIVLNHDGGLLVHTCPGVGSRFDVLLPLAEIEAESVEPAAPKPREPASPATGLGSILLVDDSTDFGDMLMTALFRLGYEISVCDDPKDALTYVREDPAAWDLVITDQAMPNMTGTELIGAIKALRPDLPCIICTAFPSQFNEEGARRAGADGFATKPLELGKFSVMVAEILAHRTSDDAGESISAKS